MIYFNARPTPSLTILGETYTGISMLEALDIIKRNPDNYPDIDQYDVDQYFNIIALYFQQPVVPTLGFKLNDENAVLPSKRIIDVGFDITIIGIHKQISSKITMYETGISISIPTGYYVELVPRSSLSKTGYMMTNSVGIIDPGYTGTIKVPLVKIDPHMDDISLPIRVAQLILKPYVFAHIEQISNITKTSRGANGFGSTGA